MALTNEKLNDRFINPFTLVTYAIGIAKERVSKGEGMASHLATNVLEEIADYEEKDEEEVESEE